MIKNSTVIKRMIRDCWKPTALIAGVVVSFLIASWAAEKFLGLNSELVYWGLVFVWFIGAGLKWTFEAKKSQIEIEQKQMLRDIEGKHL